MSTLKQNIADLQALLEAAKALPEAKDDPVFQEKAVTPTREAQAVTPDAGFDGLSKVNVGAIPADYIIPEGTASITENGQHDVREYESVNVNVPAPDPVLQAKTVSPSTSKQEVTADSGYDGLSKVTVNAMATATQATPGITVSDAGLITASATQSAGYVAAGTKSATKQLTTQAAKTVTPTTTAQTAVAKGVFTTGAVTVAAMPTAAQATPGITVSSSGLITASATQSAGYVAAGTKSATKQLTTQAAQTITPGTTDKTIAAGKYLTGAQTIKGDANLLAENIKSGVSIFGVEGTAESGGGGVSVETCTLRVTENNENYSFFSYTTATSDGDVYSETVFGRGIQEYGSDFQIDVVKNTNVIFAVNSFLEEDTSVIGDISFKTAGIYFGESTTYIVSIRVLSDGEIHIATEAGGLD